MVTDSSLGSAKRDRGRVLLVDDHPRLLHALSETLAQRVPELSVECCSSGDEAIKRLEATDYDVIVSDVMMPGVSGIDLLASARRVRPDSPVILITGLGDHDVTLRALRGGAYDFIGKPVDPVYFAMSVKRAAETRALRREVEQQQTALRRHAEELERTVAERTRDLREAVRLKDEFLATVSHELRTPLTPVLGWARLLRQGRLDEASRQQALEAIERNARAQAQLIDDLLDVSRIVTGKLRLDVQTIDLATVLAASAEVVVPAARTKGVSLELPALDRSLPPVAADPERIRQVFWNLLSNAVKFTPQGGHVAIDAARDGEQVVVRISDTGCGISPDFLPFVFDRFRQAPSSCPAARGGLGLGLAIVRHLVELHGGSVRAESDGDGRGSTFTVTLRIGHTTELPVVMRTEARETAVLAKPLERRHALVIEDAIDTRQVLTALLQMCGARVTAVANVEAGMSVVENDLPDVVLCDIGLGDDHSNGYDFVRKLRALPKDRGGSVPALALTAFAKPEDRTRALAAGFQLHIAKPGPADLGELVAGLIERKPS